MAERAVVIHRIADLYAERAKDLAAIITREMGNASADAVGEVEYVIDIYRFYADNAAALLADEPIPSGSREALIRKAPIGPLLGIMPWNYPYYRLRTARVLAQKETQVRRRLGSGRDGDQHNPTCRR